MSVLIDYMYTVHIFLGMMTVHFLCIEYLAKQMKVFDDVICEWNVWQSLKIQFV